MAFNPVQSFMQGATLRQSMDRNAAEQEKANFAQQQAAQLAGVNSALLGEVNQGGFSPSTSANFEQLSILDPTRAGQVQANFQGLSDSRKKAYHEDLQDGLRALEAGDGDRFMGIMQDRLTAIDKLNGDPTGTQFLMSKFSQGAIPELIDGLRQAESAGIVSGYLPDTRKKEEKVAVPAGQAEWEALTSDLTSEQKKEATLIKLGLSPRAVGSAIQTISDKGIEEQIGKSKATIRQREKFGELTASRRSKVIDSGFNKIEKINSAIGNIDRAIGVLNAGAGVGAIEKFLPSFKAASVELDNIQKSMALDVIGATTFGALSEGELNLAKEVALPTGLDDPQLIEYLQKRKVAQEKLRAYYREQVNFLDQGGTVAGFLRSKERESQAQQAPQSAPQQPAQPTAQQPRQGGVLHVDANGNKAMVFPDGSFEEVQ